MSKPESSKSQYDPYLGINSSREWYELFAEEDAENEWDIQIRTRKKNYKHPITIILDTNWWIYLAQGKEPSSLEEILKKLDSEEYQLLVPEIIVEEWDRNLEKTKADLEKSILEQSKNAYFIAEHLQGGEQVKFRSILNNYKTKEQERLKLVSSTINKINKIIKEKAIIIKISDEVFRLVAEYAVAKKAPFHKNKNSVADALILFSSIEYLKKTGNDKVGSSIFVSNNHRDFSSEDDKDVIHDDLIGHLKSTNTAYERNLGKAMKLVVKMEQEVDAYLEKKAESELIDEHIESQIGD